MSGIISGETSVEQMFVNLLIVQFPVARARAHTLRIISACLEGAWIMCIFSPLSLPPVQSPRYAVYENTSLYVTLGCIGFAMIIMRQHRRKGGKGRGRKGGRVTGRATILTHLTDPAPAPRHPVLRLSRYANAQTTPSASSDTIQPRAITSSHVDWPTHTARVSPSVPSD